MLGRGPPAHQIWLPPLADPPTLDQLLPPLSVDPARGYGTTGWRGNGTLTVPVAIVDKPYEQRRDLLWADFSGVAGHGDRRRRSAQRQVARCCGRRSPRSR